MTPEGLLEVLLEAIDHYIDLKIQYDGAITAFDEQKYRDDIIRAISAFAENREARIMSLVDEKISEKTEQLMWKIDDKIEDKINCHLWKRHD